MLDPFADAFEVSTHYVGTDFANDWPNIVEAIRARTEKPIYMKISPHHPVARTVRQGDLPKPARTGVVAVNSLGPTLKIDLANRQISNTQRRFRLRLDERTGDQAGRLAPPSTRSRQAAPRLTVIGVGGIKSADDVLEFLLAGASARADAFRGALARERVCTRRSSPDLPAALTKYGFASIRRSHSNRDSTTPVDYEGVVPTLHQGQVHSSAMLCVRRLSVSSRSRSPASSRSIRERASAAAFASRNARPKRSAKTRIARR
ncbi:MAG: hypothetical protein MZU97_20670 [Bacillus subtilis]|nr:hypothetical protein [Bacillus subtilis]